MAKFRTEIFFYVIDTAINSVVERFDLLNEHNSLFRFLYDIPTIQKLDDYQLKTCCTALNNALSVGEKCDISPDDLFIELRSLSHRFPLPSEDGKIIDSSPLAALTFIVQNGLSSVYPNTVIALRILLTLPVSVAQGERSFSKLKLIKTYLRSLMGQEKLDGLAMISIEREIVENIDLNEAIEEFAQKKSRKVPI
ncbi:putative Zinc finger protein [Daphnia magna]|uniref:Putative Zinc finger protein n=1 Tax=Daphnia magna TaxID=35525 RepID=A0A164JXT5_9CRUS|nr:putative Zinc finger protein [Daphnia magna]